MVDGHDLAASVDLIDHTVLTDTDAIEVLGSTKFFRNGMVEDRPPGPRSSRPLVERSSSVDSGDPFRRTV